MERSRGEALPYVSVLLLRRPPWRRLVRGRLLCDPGPFGQPACELVARAGGALGAGQEAEERIHLMFQRDIFPFYLCPACLDIFCSAVFGVVVREGDVYRWRFDGLALSFSKANYESTLETFDGEGEPPRAGEPDGPS
ncbi:MAG TPA: hypothetical protein VFS43_13930 [Polyangiaceae bacterium]|nr:hypothetical protein [Polyangiaceae bacterium]